MKDGIRTGQKSIGGGRSCGKKSMEVVTFQRRLASMEYKVWGGGDGKYGLTVGVSAMHGGISRLNSVQFTHSVVSDSLQPHESQHARPPCPLPSPGVHSDSRPSSP